MTSNLRFGRADTARVVELAVREDVDVLVLEEVTPQALDGLQAAGIGQAFPHRVGRPAAGPGGTHGVLPHPAQPRAPGADEVRQLRHGRAAAGRPRCTGRTRAPARRAPAATDRRRLGLARRPARGAPGGPRARRAHGAGRRPQRDHGPRARCASSSGAATRTPPPRRGPAGSPPGPRPAWSAGSASTCRRWSRSTTSSSRTACARSAPRRSASTAPTTRRWSRRWPVGRDETGRCPCGGRHAAVDATTAASRRGDDDPHVGLPVGRWPRRVDALAPLARRTRGVTALRRVDGWAHGLATAGRGRLGMRRLTTYDHPVDGIEPLPSVAYLLTEQDWRDGPRPGT